MKGDTMSLSIKNKLIFGFSIVVVIMVAISVYGLINLNSVNSNMETMYKDRAVAIGKMGTVNTALYTIRGDVYKYFLLPDQRKATVAEIAKQKEIVKTELDAFRSTNMLGSEAEVITALDKGRFGKYS
jgi:hypothetical protein